ncbi:MAG: phosphate regulon sensor histidine kinase PhoR [Thiohalomonadaceae bacterium]
MSGPWSAELWRIASIAFFSLLVGLVFGRPALFGVLGLFAYFGWHLLQLYRLERWLRVGRKLNPPEGWGIWGEVFHHIYALQQRNRRRKRLLAGILSQYQKATAAMPDATVVLGPNWEIQWFNEAAIQLLDLQSGHDVGQRIDNLIRVPAFGMFLADGAEGTLEMTSPRDPRLTLSLRVVPYGDEQRLLIARDVSEKLRLEQMRRDFIGNVSHELRTPLTVISGFLETLAEDDDEHGGRLGRTLGLMREQSRRMQHLVEDLLLLSRLENERQTPERELVAVPGMLTTMLEDARLLSRDKGHVIELECDTGLGLYGAEREIYSAFNNLVTNAVRYTPAGGRIMMRWYADEAGAHFSVRDNGVGIAPVHLPRLTERFYRVDPGRSREYGGTGLGLAIVKHVLQRHDAHLSIESTPGRGSTFACDFPPQRVHRIQAPAPECRNSFIEHSSKCHFPGS